MKKFLISAGALAALALSTPAFAATLQPNQAQAKAYANIVTGITVTKNADLNFGTLASGPGGFAGEKVHVNSAGSLTCPAPLTCTDSANVAAAKFTVTGTAGQAIVLTLPTSVTLASGTNSLSVDLSNDEPTKNQTLDTNGSYQIAMGGVLTIPSGTVDGLYSGDILVTANYQ